MDLKDIPYEFILDLQFSSTITVLNIDFGTNDNHKGNKTHV